MYTANDSYSLDLCFASEIVRMFAVMSLNENTDRNFITVEIDELR